MIHPKIIRRQQVILFALVGLILVTVLIGMGMGNASVSYNRLLPILFGQGTFKEEFVLFSIRLPRIAITFLAGMALAVSGAILQAVTRNDLAEPGMIGINSGAGVAIAIFFLFFPLDAGSFIYLLPVIAFFGSLLTACLIYLFSYKKGVGLQPVQLILTGVGFTMALSGVMVVLISSAERRKVDFIVKWLSGNIWGNDWSFVLAILPWLVITIFFTLYKSNRLNLLGLSEPVAIGVGPFCSAGAIHSPFDRCCCGFRYRRDCFYRIIGSSFGKSSDRSKSSTVSSHCNPYRWMVAFDCGYHRAQSR